MLYLPLKILLVNLIFQNNYIYNMVIWSYTKKKKKKEGNMVCVYIYICCTFHKKKKKKKIIATLGLSK